MKINEDYLRRLLNDPKRVDSWNYGLDYLGLSIHGKLQFATEWLQTLDEDNSGQAYFDGEYFTYTVSKGATHGHASLWILMSIDGVAYPIIEIIDFTKSGKGFIKADYGVYVLGTLFRFIEQGVIPDFDTIFKDIFNDTDMLIIKKSHFNRADMKIDIMTKEERSIPSIKSVVKKRKDTGYRKWSQGNDTHAEYRNTKQVVSIFEQLQRGEKLNFEAIEKQTDGDYITGWSVGKKASKTVTIRCYDKLLDSISKGKRKLYDDYFNYKSVFRLECEFKTRFCRDELGYPFEYRDIDKLIEKAKSYMGLGPKRDSGYCYRPNYEMNKVNIPYTKRYKNAGYKIYKNDIAGTQLYWDKLFEEGHSYEELVSLYRKDENYIQNLYGSIVE